MSHNFPAVRFYPGYDSQLALIRQTRCERCGIYSTYLILDACRSEPEMVARACALLGGAHIESTVDTGYGQGRYSYVFRFLHLYPLRTPRAFVKAKAKALRRMIAVVEEAEAWTWYDSPLEDQDVEARDDYMLSFSNQN